ncbi:S8 family serine peptidase [Natrialba sp. INN-245]|uniref:S8 family serine peptidase n=1 Tax=Natrialba sp. INN-245 TaxID=2690967 RepID=UPI00131354A7|nr:S8 family serine peptidase [Natrialba sp. INN-245]MWV41508.1 S8 family serine peptidase [Natrialba sp. INN-245]
MLSTRSLLVVATAVALVVAVVALVAVPVVDVGIDRSTLSPTDGEPTGDADWNQDDRSAESITVAVLDTGIDDDHPDLEGTVVDRIDLTEAAGSGERDEYGHGTHVAGVLAGSGEASNGRHVGVAPDVDLVDVRVLRAEGDGDADRIASGIEYAVDDADADVVLLSLDFGGTDEERIAESIAWAVDSGAVVVASAGNDGEPRTIGTPGTEPQAITVGATDADGTVSTHSSQGPTLEGHLKPELVAPGEEVVGPRAGYDGSGDDAYTTRTGTSFAAPTVAGATALALEADPTLSPADVEGWLTSTARPVEDEHAYASGSGELGIDRVLEPDVVASDGAVDAGIVGPNETVTRTVTLENRGDRRHDLSFETPARTVDGGTDAAETVSVNRSDLALAPGERADLAVTVDGSRAESGGAHTGEIRYDIDGEPRSIAVGFVRGGTVTVEKRPLSAGGSVEGDALLVFTEDDSRSELLEFENGRASFVAGSGDYVLWSAGVDDRTGSLVMLSERLEVDGSERVLLDESETIPVGVDADPIVAEYGPLANHSVAASMSTDTGGDRAEFSRTILDADNRTVRVSEDPETSIATTYLLTPASGDDRLDTPDVFQLHHADSSAHWTSPVKVHPDDLETTTYRIHRTTRDRTLEGQDRTTVRTVWNNPSLYWFELGDRELQRVHRTADGATHERQLRGDGWRAVLEDDADSVDALAHPMIALVGDVSIDDGRVAVEGRPVADGAGTRIVASDEHAMTVDVDGERIDTVRGGPDLSISDVDVEHGESVTIRANGSAPDDRLSTTTLTEVTIHGYEPGIDHRPPIARDVSVPDANGTNAVDPGEVTVTIDADELSSVSGPTVWYATDETETPPWEDETGWERASTGRDDDLLTATLEAPDDAETMSLAVELETIRDDRSRTMTTNAVYVGSAPNTSARTIGGQLRTANGTPADNDSVVVAPVDGDTGTAVRTDEDGTFDLEVPKNESYDLSYRRGVPREIVPDAGEPWSIGDPTDDGRPAMVGLGRVHAETDVTIDRSLPEAKRLDVRVVDERNESVPNATVRVGHRGEHEHLTATAETGSDGTLSVGEDDARGVALSGPTSVVVEPPADGPHVDEPAVRNVTVTGENRTETVVLETPPPEASLSSNHDWLLEGTPVTLKAGDSDVPAGVAEYRWDIDGDGSTDRVTNESTTRYTPDTGESEPSVTVVDAAGKTDTDSTSIRVDQVG